MLVLAVVYRTISRHLFHKAGLTLSSGATGAVTLVQRFGSALNLNVHFHVLFLGGMYGADHSGELVFRHVGPRAGQKLFTLQTVPPRLQGLEGEPSEAARAGGFSLHAGIDIAPHERAKLERLCRYVSRPPVATERMALTSSGHVRYQLKTPYHDGTTHIVLEPLDFMARLAALVPPPRMHLTLIPRGVRTAQQAARRRDAGASRHGQPKAGRRG